MSSATLPMASVGDGHLEASSAIRSIPLLPRNTVLSLLHGYRATISHAYGDVCKYYPSCSAYAAQAIRRYGILRGLVLGGWRLLRCNPWSHGGFDPVEDQRIFRTRSSTDPDPAR